jgi:hypothetical protein
VFATLARRWVVMAVALPLAAAGARMISQKVEERRGANAATRLLRRAADTIRPPKKKSRFRPW